MIHPNSELRFISPEIGFGVFATKRIPRGTITWTRCAFDRSFTPEEMTKLDPFYAPILHKYAYVDRHGNHVLCWDLGRFMNHSCEPTCLSPGFDFDVAVRDIEAGQELTCDYGMLNLNESFECGCGRAGCRHTVAPNDWQELADSWDGLLRTAVRDIGKHEQLLWPIVKNKPEIEAAAAGSVDVPSCRVHFVTR